MKRPSLILLLLTLPFLNAGAAQLEFNRFAIPALKSKLPDPQGFSCVLTFQAGVVIGDHVGYNGEVMQSLPLNTQGVCNLRIVYVALRSEKLELEAGLPASVISGTARMRMLSYTSQLQDKDQTQVRLRYFTDGFLDDAAALNFVQTLDQSKMGGTISAIECAGPVTVDLSRGIADGDALLQQLIGKQIGPSLRVSGQ